MTGYVVIDKGELKIKEFEVYKGYYCGMCKSIGKRFGQIPRIGLTYDAVFLALILDGLSEEPVSVEQENCLAHPFKKNPVILNRPAIDYSADMMIILGYNNFKDDYEDGEKFKGATGKQVLKKAYKRLLKAYPEVCIEVDNQLCQLKRLEDCCSSSLDLTSETFGKIMSSVFSSYDGIGDEATRRVLKHIGYYLGKWIYTIDALDDYEDDLTKGQYNPLKYRPSNIDGIDNLLYNYMAEITSGMDLLELHKNREIINNVLYLGMRAQMDRLLEKGSEHNE